ncbi:MAG TPA: hypothetical protein ENN73_06415, partial [Firmicutes bacterium]|nr:hypothetical protein [Bacillota bacterium]
MKKISCILLCVVFSVSLTFAGETAGIVSDVRGTVTILRGSETLTAVVGSEILNNDRIKPSQDSAADILLTNGDYLSVKENEEKTITIKTEATRSQKDNKESSEFFSADTRDTILANPVSL